MSLSIAFIPFYYGMEQAGQLLCNYYRQKVVMTQDITDSITNNTGTANEFFTESINSRILKHN